MIYKTFKEKPFTVGAYYRGSKWNPIILDETFKNTIVFFFLHNKTTNPAFCVYDDKLYHVIVFNESEEILIDSYSEYFDQWDDKVEMLRMIML